MWYVLPAAWPHCRHRAGVVLQFHVVSVPLAAEAMFPAPLRFFVVGVQVVAPPLDEHESKRRDVFEGNEGEMVDRMKKLRDETVAKNLEFQRQVVRSPGF